MKQDLLTLVRAAVVAKSAFWDALGDLEKAVTTSGEFSDKANDQVIDYIDDLASADAGNFPEGITQENVDDIIKLARKS